MNTMMHGTFSNPFLTQLAAAGSPFSASALFLNADAGACLLQGAAAAIHDAIGGTAAAAMGYSIPRLLNPLEFSDTRKKLATVIAGIPQREWDEKATDALLRRASIFGTPPHLLPEIIARHSLGQRVSVLREHGIPNPEAVAELEHRRKFHLNLDPQAIAARAEELSKMFEDTVIPIPPGYAALPNHQQQAVQLMARAAQYMDVPFRLQYDVDSAVFEELMQAPIFAPLRRYYERFASPYDFLRHDGDRLHHGFLPGTEHLTQAKGSGLYPSDISEDEFRAYAERHPDQAADMRVIYRRDHQGRLYGIPFAEAFSAWLEPAAKLISQAAALLDHDAPKTSAYLRALAKAYRDNTFTAADIAWVRSGGSLLEVDLGPVEQYSDEFRSHTAGLLSGEVQVRDPEREGLLNALREAFGDIESRLPVAERYKRPAHQRTPPPFLSVDNIFAAGHGSTGPGVAIAYNRPNGEEERKFGVKIVSMDNVVAARDTSPVGKMLTELALHPDQRSFVSGEALAAFIAFHEFAHGRGVEYVVNTPKMRAREAIGGKLYNSFEELRADIVGLETARIAAEMGLISQELLQQMHVSYVRRCIVGLRKGTAEAHNRGTLVALNILNEKGAVTINADNGMTRVHLDVIPQVITAFARELLTIKGDGNKAAVEELYASYGVHLPAGVQSIYDAMEHLPRETFYRYEFADVLAQSIAVGDGI